MNCQDQCRQGRRACPCPYSCELQGKDEYPVIRAGVVLIGIGVVVLTFFAIGLMT